MKISVQTESFDIGIETATISHNRTDIGAIASFIGLARDTNSGSEVSAMTLEHYPAMTEKALAEIVNEALQRWVLLGVTLIHRVGRLLPGDPIVLVIVASSHRAEAFAACEFLMDALKTRAPFWKKEETSAGERWVEARESDDAAADRWRDTENHRALKPGSLFDSNLKHQPQRLAALQGERQAAPCAES